MVTSSGTSWPASMYRLASTPSGVPWATLARKMSPVEIFGTDEVRGDELGLCALARPGRDQTRVRSSSSYRRNPS